MRCVPNNVASVTERLSFGDMMSGLSVRAEARERNRQSDRKHIRYIVYSSL